MNIERWIIIEEDMRSVGCRGKWNDCSNIEEYVRVDMRKDEIKQTIEYYNKNAESFVKTTRDVDFSEAGNIFLSYVRDGGSILDFGCGSGRDSRYFLEKGYDVSACDASEAMCRLASEYIGIMVKKMYFEELNDESKYDGIWACASLLHLSEEELKDVIVKIKRALKPDGVLYASFKYGIGSREKNGRYFTDMNEESVKKWLSDAGMSVCKIWISGDVREGRDGEKWVNVVGENREQM